MKKKINKAFASLLVILGAAITVFFIAVIAGTIIYFLWPIVVPAVLPALVKGGMLPAVLSWKVAVCFSWLFNIFFTRSKS